MSVSYHGFLVVLSFLVAVLASYTALSLAGRVAQTRTMIRTSRFWLVAGAVSMGTGVWSMHFIGMLAMSLPVPVTYDVATTLLSLLIAIAISGFALWTVSQTVLGIRRLIRGALLMGAGISAMHYLGMAALNLSIDIRYDPGTVFASVSIACTASLAALWLSYRLRAGRGWRMALARGAAALIMGIAIAGMHYTGMAAAWFDPDAICIGGVPIEGVGFATALAMIAAAILAITLIVSIFDAQLQSRQGKFVAKLREDNAVLRQRDAARNRELEDLYEHAPCGYYSIDAGGVFQRMNATALQWLGFTSDEVIGRVRLLDIVVPGQHSEVAQRLIRFMEGGNLVNEELAFVRKDGSSFFVSVNATAVRDGDGRFISSRSSIFDITARNNAEQALQRSTAFLDSVIESIPIAMFVKDARTRRYVRMNRTGAELVGFSCEQLIGHTPEEVFAPELASIHRQLDDQVLARNGLVQFDPVITPIRPGHRPMLQTMKTVIPDEHGQPLYLLGIMTDVTERHRINAELERKTHEADEANRAKSSFLAAMSHEIRTPMNGVIGMVEVLDQTVLTADQRDMTEGIRSSSFSLLAIIDDVLDFSKIEAGRLELERVVVSVPGVVEAAAESLSALAVRGGVELVVFCDPRIPARLVTDPTRLRQILMNLGGNAIKFSQAIGERKGVVEIRADLGSLTKDVAEIRIRVIDNGIGMSTEAMAGLFRPFVQAESSTTRRFGGTGLGLTICQRIAGAMGSEVTVSSEPGAGSTFSVTLDLDAAIGAAVPVPDARLAGVLVVSIGLGTAIGKIVESYLCAEGASVLVCRDEADARLQLSAPDSRRERVTFVAAGDGAGGPHLPGLTDRLRALADNDGGVSFVLLSCGRLLPEMSGKADTVTLDRIALRRSVLVRAVQVAAGLALPDADGACVETAPERRAMLGIDEAEAAGRLILVAEDHLNNRKVLAHQLALLGHTAEMDVDGRHALSMWHGRQYALVLTDCHMPDLDGFGLTAAIRDLEAGTPRRTPIIAVTANAMKGEADRCIRAGMDDYLTKPLQLAQLRTALDKWLNRGAPKVGSDAVEAAVAAARGEPGEQAVREATLSGVLGTDDPDVLKSFYLDFMRSASDAVGRMSSGQGTRALKELGGLAHRLKSSAGTIGADPLSDACNALERACRDGNEAQSILDLERVRHCFESVRAWMAAHPECS